MEFQRFARRVFYIDAVQVTADNMEEIASWCKGHVVQNSDHGTHIKVKVRRPLNSRQTRAEVGDWVLKAGRKFKVYTPDAFESSFVPAPEDGDPVTKQGSPEIDDVRPSGAFPEARRPIRIYTAEEQADHRQSVNAAFLEEVRQVENQKPTFPYKSPVEVKAKIESFLPVNSGSIADGYILDEPEPVRLAREPVITSYKDALAKGVHKYPTPSIPDVTQLDLGVMAEPGLDLFNSTLHAQQDKDR